MDERVEEYDLGYTVQNIDFAPGPDSIIATSSFIEDDTNHVDIFQVSSRRGGILVNRISGLNLAYPATSCNWLSPTSLVCTGEDVRVFDVRHNQKPELLRTWVHESVKEAKDGRCTPITSSCCDQTNMRVVTTDVYGSAAIWNPEYESTLLVLNLSQPLYDVVQDPKDPNVFALAASSGAIFRFDQREPSKVHQLVGVDDEQVGGPVRMAWGEQLAVTWLNHGLYMYDATGNTSARNSMPRLKSAVEYLCWDRDRLVCARTDGICNVVGLCDLYADDDTEMDTYTWTPRQQVSPCTAVAVDRNSFCALACHGVVYLAKLPRH